MPEAPAVCRPGSHGRLGNDASSGGTDGRSATWMTFASSPRRISAMERAAFPVDAIRSSRILWRDRPPTPVGPSSSGASWAPRMGRTPKASSGAHAVRWRITPGMISRTLPAKTSDFDVAGSICATVISMSAVCSRKAVPGRSHPEGNASGETRFRGGSRRRREVRSSCPPWSSPDVLRVVDQPRPDPRRPRST